ncbi:ABC transporter ATP-binding protein [Bulleidia sp. zg-1006]|uniref:ABC transporter ATP-binding protein n=1 Tax=Bulleidia sp. zg-1006 TaxID=2806552 RepID=UPI001939C74C|nr:ABC transporter ATP-binding protein [Bulleidia sp. zg-1006]QRG87441.1 ABC transporter ATP-binding protein [Bulleidia sp. zg-1006]
MLNKFLSRFGLSEKGIHDTKKAAALTSVKFVLFTTVPMLVFVFLQNYMQNQLHSLWFYLAILVSIIFVKYFLLKWEYKLTYDTTYEESIAMRVQIADRFRKLPLSYFSKHNLSDLSQTVMMDVGNLEMFMSHALPQGIGFVLFYTIMTVFLLIGNVYLGIAVCLPIWIALVLILLTKDIQTRNVKKYYQQLLKNSNSFQDAFEMQQEIKSYSMQEQVKQDVARAIDDTEILHRRADFTMASISALIGVLPYLAPFFTAIVGAYLFQKGQLSILYFLGYLMAAGSLSSQFNSMKEYLLMGLFFLDSFKRITDLNNEKIQEGTDISLHSFDIEFQKVGFAYAENKVIEDLSFCAKQGQVTALVGPSGCGKTTVLRLLSRLYDYQEGKILIGGHDIQSISTQTLFQNISIVFQEVELFNTSILENIRIGRKEAGDEEVLAAAKAANVDKIVSRLPDGYQTKIGENGSRLSGGERQRISIARAFLKDAPIILLDEISASLDVENEMEIQQAINQLIQNKTVLIVTHRLKSIEKVNQILVLKDGQLDHSGQHEDLMKNCDLYQLMVKRSSLSDEYLY